MATTCCTNDSSCICYKQAVSKCLVYSNVLKTALSSTLWPTRGYISLKMSASKSIMLRYNYVGGCEAFHSNISSYFILHHSHPIHIATWLLLSLVGVWWNSSILTWLMSSMWRSTFYLPSTWPTLGLTSLPSERIAWNDWLYYVCHTLPVMQTRVHWSVSNVACYFVNLQTV